MDEGSIMRADWSIRTRHDGRTTMMDVRRASKWAGTPFEISSIRGYHSDFPHNIGRFLTRWLCPETLETPGYFRNLLPTVFDPFAGHWSRAEDVFLCHRNYVGWDICKEFMEVNRQIRARLLSDCLWPTKPGIELVENDSRKIITYYEDGNLFDMALTSPPFWNREYYGAEREQLGLLRYEDFMKDMEGIFRGVYRVLKPGTFFACECNDFRRNGVLVLFHCDIIQAMVSAGFTPHDLIVADLGRSIQSIFASELERNKTVGKRHSYFIVGQKG